MKKAWNCEPTEDGRIVQVLYRGKDLEMALPRCPMWYIRKEVWIVRAINAYLRWRDKSVLPFAGGFEDQPVGFHSICDILDECFVAMRGKNDG